MRRHNSRSPSWTSTALLALALAGCKASIGASASTAPPPKPEPAPPPEVADSDKDGINDEQDMCPDRPGVANTADPERNGCPERRSRARMKKNRLVIDEKIMFATNKAEIDSKSATLLDEIAETIKEAGRRVSLIEVAGHADKRGKVARNLTLTDERAKAVVAALVERGVEAEKLRAKGYGSYCPVDPANDDANRRVEFIVVKGRARLTNEPLGCEAATAAGVSPDPLPEEGREGGSSGGGDDGDDGGDGGDAGDSGDGR